MMKGMSERRTPILAAVLWISAASVYLLAEAVTASAFPGYSYASNYISDLGIPDVGSYQGRAIDSPLHPVMNTAFVASGVLFLAAAASAARAGALPSRRALLVLSVIYAVGISLVGLVHGSQASADDGTGVLHVFGAALAIVGGNVLAIVVGAASRRAAQRVRAGRLRRRGGALASVYPALSVGLGVLGLVGLLGLEIDSGSTSIDLLPEGIWERIAVYTVTAWQLLTGILLLSRGRAGSAG